MHRLKGEKRAVTLCLINAGGKGFHVVDELCSFGKFANRGELLARFN